MTKTLDSVILRYVGFGLIFLSAAVLLYLVRGALPVFVVGGIIAYALEPVLQKLEKSGRSRKSAVGFVFVIYLLLGLIFLSLLAAAFQQGLSLASNIPTYNRQVTALVQNNRRRLDESKLPKAVKASINDGIDTGLSRFGKQVPEIAPKIAAAGAAGVGTFLINLFLLNLITLGLMLEAQAIRGRILMLIPSPYRRDMTELSQSINELLGRYVRGQMIVCGTYGALCTVAFEVLSRVYGMQYPLVLGAMAATLYILPYFGPAIIFTSAGVAAYFTSAHPVPCALAALGSCIVLNLIVDYGVAPRVLGKGVGLHPLMVIFALLCGLQLAGPLGTVVAVPIFASLRVIAIYLFPQLAVPLPTESPEATSLDKPHDSTSEMTQRVAKAEASV
ncbi:putative PurR-regulated permease PerM [Abditibacterium utsteinense]|uniref:Putative PurR-regulated permease PerM n=1 Tax=Abditibacterium utsteinense TaxID=1960156 RepID=A0A2S8SXA7_9BACT|nr:AI-2E family transporter [Abditibacterium utsteinense]PQV65442.1 putative PurR-regulated permease PerM [Abditibacterium utsteinense]